MMRRSRISVKPNFRAGNRTGAEGERTSQEAREAGDPLPAVEADQVARPAPSHQQNVAQKQKEPSEDVGIKDPSEMSPQINQTDGAPSSGATTSSAAPHRRMRILAAPKLVGPKFTSTPQARSSARKPNPSPLSNKEHVQIHDLPSKALTSVSVISNDLPESGTLTKSTSPTKLPTQSSTTTHSSSLCVPLTSGRLKSLVCEKSVEDSPPSPQPGQVPQQRPQEPPKYPSSFDLSSVSITPSHCDQADSSEMTKKSSDKEKILRALKLKELMKIERRKDIQKGRRKVGHKEYTALDRSKMTMRDLIYYLPNTSPMRSSLECEEDQAETIIPPSPKHHIKPAEMDDEEEEEEESVNEEMLVPKVRVAEDGSIILDEESLTVRVQRPSNTKVIESSFALFERGSTTTYASFRTVKHVKSWSVRETDLFFLAISMVGTDFSLIGQLLSHRSRAEIKNKFKKEERVNPWRIDKALRNKRPYDKEFFSYLLEKILAKDKDKRKSIKLILPKRRKSRKSKANTLSKDLEESEDDGDVGVEEENADLSNLKEADISVPAKKRRRRSRDVSKDKDNDNSTEEQVKRKRQRKCRKKTREVDTNNDTEGESNLVDDDTINVINEDELERSTSASKRRRKRSTSKEEEQNDKPAKGTKKKKKKSLKVVCGHDESAGEHEASSIMDEDGSATKKKRKRAKISDLDGDEPAKGGKDTKNKKALKSTIEEEKTEQEGEVSADLQEAEKLNSPASGDIAGNVPPKTTRRSKKPSPNLPTTRSRKSKKSEAPAEVERECEDENNHESILTTAGSPLEDERLQMQAVVVLERTPPRQTYLLSPSEVQCKTNELEASVSSPASPSSGESSPTKQTRMQRAGRVKRDLSTGKKTGSKKGRMGQDEAEPQSPMVLLERITQEFKDDEDDSLNENLMDLSCLRDLNSQSFQRRPMVVLSREEVDMVLHASDQSADEDPSVSPLDLSLNTELSFPLQCSKLLEDSDEAAEEAACVLEKHEEGINKIASYEEKNCKELRLTEPTLAQPDISYHTDMSTSISPEVCSQPEVALSKVTTPCSMEEAEPQVQPMTHKGVTTVLEDSPPLVVLDNVDPICMKLDAHMTQERVSVETTTLGTSLVVLDVMEESEKARLPILLKKPTLASSRITVKSDLTPTGSMLGSQGSLQATPEVKGELQTSLEGPWQTLEKLQRSSDNKEDTQDLPSAMAHPEIKARLQGCVVAPRVKEDSQEQVSAQSSGATISPEHGHRPPKRSRFLKPKPNLSQKARVTVLQNQKRDLKTPSTLKPKSIEPISHKKLLHSPAADWHGVLDDLTKEKETSQSNAVDQVESESTKDVTDTSTVPDQGNSTTITSSPASANEPRVASEGCSSRCEVDMILPRSTLTLPQPLHTGEDAGSGQMIIPSKGVCAPAEIVNQTEDAYNDEEPTFILNLYEIPVTQAYLPSSINDSAMTSDLPTVGNQLSLGFSDQAHTFPSTSESYRIDSLPMESSGSEKMYSQNDLGVGTGNLAGNVKEQLSAHLASEITSPHTKDEDSNASANLEIGISSLDPDSECKKGLEFAPLDDLAPRIQSTSSGFSVSKCSAALPRDSEDTEQRERVSPMVLGHVFVPVSEEMGDDSGKERAMAVESKVQSNEGSSTSVAEDLAKNTKKQTSLESISLETKNEESDASAKLETGIPHIGRDSECQKGLEFAPLDDLASSSQSMPSGLNILRCITALPRDSEDSEQCEQVSHMVLGDVFVPVSEDTEDDSSKDRTIAVECRVESKEVSSTSVTEDLAENAKEQISEHMTSHNAILLDTKDEESDTCADLETGIPHSDQHSEYKIGSEIAPLEDLMPRIQSTSSGFSVSKCIKTLPQDPEDTEQCENVSHKLLPNVFVPVSEDSCKDRAIDVECKLHSKEASKPSLPDRLDTPYEELTKVDNLPDNPLLRFDSTDESKDKPPLSEEKKAPGRRRARQIKPQPKLVRRACATDDPSKTDKLVKEPSQPTTSRVVLPASHRENMAGISNTTEEKAAGTMLPERENKTFVSRGVEVKPKSIAEASPKKSQDDLPSAESKPTSTAVNLHKEPTLKEENCEKITGDTIIKDDIESSVEVLMSGEGINVQPCCEDMRLSLMKASGSSVDTDKTEAETQGVSHMLLPDVFVLVSDEMEDDLSNNWTVSIESSPQRVGLPKKSGAHFQKDLKNEAVSQTLTEESTQNQSPLMDIKTPVRKRGKQEVMRTCTNDSTKTRPPTSPQATSPPSQQSSLPQNENMELLEEELQREHHIMPCTVRLSSLGTLNAPQLGDKKSNDESKVISSPTCHATVTTLSVESSTQSRLNEMKLKDPKLEIKSPTRRKGKKNESSPHTKHSHLKPVQSVTQTRQLTLTDWVNKISQQTIANQEESVKSSQMQSNLKVVEKACSKSQHADLEEPKCSYLVPALEETEEAGSSSEEVKRSSEVFEESTEEPSVSQVKNAPTRRRAKLQVKPILSKGTCTKTGGDTPTTDQPQPLRFTSPTRQHARAAREKEEPDSKPKQAVKEDCNASSMKANSKSTESSLIASGPQSPKSQDAWPKVVLPRVKLWTTEAGICSASSTPTSSPARVSESASPPVTPPQLKKSPTQNSSPTASENPGDDPSRVSQFFLCDIFTEVEEAE